MTNVGGCAKIGDQSVLLHETIQDKLTTYSVRLPICVSWMVAKEVAKKEPTAGRPLVQGPQGTGCCRRWGTLNSNHVVRRVAVDSDHVAKEVAKKEPTGRPLVQGPQDTGCCRRWGTLNSNHVVRRVAKKETNSVRTLV